MFRTALLTSFLVCSIYAAIADEPKKADTPASKPAAPSAASKRSRGDELLGQAIKNLEKLKWMDTRIVQRGNSQGVKYTATGRMVVADGRKVNYQLNVRVGGVVGTSRIIVDGTNLWQVEQVGDNRKFVQTYKLAELDDALKSLDDDDIGKRIREEVSAEFGFAGIRPVLQDLQKRVNLSSVDEAEWAPGGKTAVPVYILEGEWNKETREQIAPQRPEAAGGPDPVKQWEGRQGFLYIPRRCRLYLDRQSLWPYRVEWLGITQPGGRDEVLVSVDYADPVLKPPSGTDDEKLFSLALSAEEEKQGRQAKPLEFIKARRDQLDRQKQEEERRKSLQPTEISK